MIEAGQGGMPKTSRVMANQVRTVDKKRPQQKFGQLPPDLMRQVDAALRLHLSLE